MTEKEQQRYWFMRVIESFLNMPYRWGGDDPEVGYDCSGMVLEGLKSIGLIDYNVDKTADGLWHWFKDNRTAFPKRGSLIFWFKDNGKVRHIAVCVDENFCITADGGGRQTVTLEDAVRQNAFIKIRPIGHRKSKPKYIHLF